MSWLDLIGIAAAIIATICALELLAEITGWWKPRLWFRR